MTTHASTLSWKIPWIKKPGRLQSMGSLRVRHDWSDLACMHALEKEMAIHSSILAWRIPGTKEPGGLPSMGSHSIGHDWSKLAAAAESLTLICLLQMDHWPLVFNHCCKDYFQVKSGHLKISQIWVDILINTLDNFRKSLKKSRS